MADRQRSELSSTTNLDTREESLLRVLGRSETALRLAKAYIKCKNDKLQALGSEFDADDYLQVYNEFKIPSWFTSRPDELSIISAVVKTTMAEVIMKEESFGCDAAMLMLTMSYFAPGDIPLVMISKLAANRQQLERIIQMLDEFSLVKWNRDTGVLEVDDLIRQASNRELDHEDGTIGTALKAVSDTDSTTIHHALEVWNRASKCKRWPKELHGTSCHIIRVYMNLGDYGAALRFGRRALEVVKGAIAHDHPGLLKLEDIVRSIPLAEQTAEEKLRQIEESELAAQQQPERAAEVLTRQHTLAIEMTSNAKGALKALKEVYEKRLDSLGSRHRETLLTKGHVARLEYRLDRNKCDECFQILVDVVEVLGDGTEADCEEIADIRRCLVRMLVQKGKLDEALTRARAFHDVCERLLKPEHGITMKLLKDIGEILLKRNEHKDALAVFTRVHKLQRETLGPNHFKARRTLDRMKDTKAKLDESNGCRFMRELFLLGTLRESARLFARGNYYEAASLIEMIEVAGLPATSSIHLITLALRAKMHARADMIGSIVMGDAKKIELVIYEEYMKSMKRYDRDQVGEFLERYETALRLLKEDEYEASNRVFVSCLKKERRNSDFDDVLQLKEKFDCAELLSILEPTGSLRLLEEVFEKQMELLGPDDLVTLNTQHEIACVLHKLNRHKDAIEHFRHIYKKKKQLFGPEHYETYTANYNVARSLVAQEDFQEALDIFRLVFDDRDVKLGAEHPATLMAQYYMAHCLSRQGKYLDSFPLFKKVYSAQKRVLGTGHPDTLETKKGLELCESRLKQDPKCPTSIDQALGDHTAAKTRDLYRNINEGNVKAVKNLLRESVDITQVVTDQGLTLLHTATLTWNVKMVEAIVARATQHLNGENFHDIMNARTTSDQNTALHLAAEGGHLEIVLFLLQHRAVYELKNKRGKKPIDVATTKKIGKLLTLIDELFEKTKQGKTGVLDVVNGLSVDKIRAVYETHNVSHQSLIDVAESNRHTHLVRELRKCFKEKVPE